MYRVIFQCFTRETSSIDLSFHIFFTHVLWHSLKAIFPPQSILWGPCLASLCQIAAPSSHLVTSQAGAGWWQSWKHYQQTDTEREEEWGYRSPEFFRLCLHPWIFAMSKAIRAFSLLLPILYLLLSFSYLPLYCCDCLQQWWRVSAYLNSEHNRLPLDSCLWSICA